jgi:aspartate racemase
MKTIGLLGGMSWESTIPYYRYVNEVVKARLGGLHSARVVLYSVDFHEVELLQREGNWAEAGRLLAGAAASVERAGADVLVLCTNTMHKVAPEIERAVSIPLLHIADATADVIKSTGVRSVGLLGTKFTMEEEFYVGRLRERHGFDVLVPDRDDRDLVHRVIYDELCMGQVLDPSRDAYHQVIERLVSRGARGIILGCTEISLLVEPARLSVPAFDTTRLHAQRAAEWALDA